MSTTTNKPRLADKYKQDVVPALMKKFSYKTVMQAPRLTKICLNRGVNGAVTDKKLNFFIKAGTTSFLYLSANLGLFVVVLIILLPPLIF